MHARACIHTWTLVLKTPFQPCSRDKSPYPLTSEPDCRTAAIQPTRLGDVKQTSQCTCQPHARPRETRCTQGANHAVGCLAADSQHEQTRTRKSSSFIIPFWCEKAWALTLICTAGSVRFSHSGNDCH